MLVQFFWLSDSDQVLGTLFKCHPVLSYRVLGRSLSVFALLRESVTYKLLSNWQPLLCRKSSAKIQSVYMVKLTMKDYTVSHVRSAHQLCHIIYISHFIIIKEMFFICFFINHKNSLFWLLYDPVCLRVIVQMFIEISKWNPLSHPEMEQPNNR